MPETLTHNTFEELRTTFSSKLRSKLNQIDEEIQHVLQSEMHAPDTLVQLHSTMHKFVGSTGIYGFSTLSMIGGKLLEWTHAKKASPSPLLEADKTELYQLFQELHEETQNILGEQVSPPSTAPQLNIPPINRFQTRCALKGDVYIVDDDKEQAEALKFYLSQTGFHVTTFSSIEEAEIAFAATKPSAIIMDMMFPEGEYAGAEITDRLHQKLGQEVPVLILSARRDFEARLKATRAGASHYFTKPVDISRMIVELNKLSSPSHNIDCRILLIDDDQEITTLMGMRLEKEGFHVCTINDPQHSLEVIDQFDPDLLLVDLNMPECNGLELAKLIRQHEMHYDLPIMFLTSETAPQAKLDAIELGSDDFFNKQEDSAYLIQALKSRTKRIREFAKVKKATIWAP